MGKQIPKTKISNGEIATSFIGVVLGTGLVAYSQTNAIQAEWSKWLITISPTVAVLGDKISLYLYSFLINTIKVRKQKGQYNKIKTYMENPYTTPEHKKNLINRMQTIELASVVEEEGRDLQLLNVQSNSTSQLINDISANMTRSSKSAAINRKQSRTKKEQK